MIAGFRSKWRGMEGDGDRLWDIKCCFGTTMCTRDGDCEYIHANKERKEHFDLDLPEGYMHSQEYTHTLKGMP